MARIPLGKITIAGTPIGFVSRERLLNQIDEAPEQSVVLVSAPPGFGKTCLLSDWAVRRARGEVAWLSLDEDDNDTGQLWHALLEAMLASPAVSADSPLRSVRRDTSRTESWLGDEIMVALDEQPTPVPLVVDNVDALVDPTVLDCLRELVRHQPRGLRLILSSRADPPISVPRLRLEGAVHEIRAESLRFSSGEARQLLEAVGVRLNGPQLTALTALTGGWAAALRFAALSLRNIPEAGEFVTEFSGDDNMVADYLVSEVLSDLPPTTRDLLGDISVCPECPSELAIELVGRDDIQGLLNQLEYQAALVSHDAKQDRYRLQPLVRTYLHADLRRADPARWQLLHKRAALWWARRGAPAEALAHATTAADRTLLVQLLWQFGLRLIVTGGHQHLRAALRALREQDRRSDPWLMVCSAMCQLEAGNLIEAAADLAEAERAWPDQTAPNLLVGHAAARLVHARHTGAAAFPALPMPTFVGVGHEPEVVALAGFVSGIAQLDTPGHQTQARTRLTGALAVADEHEFGYLAMQCRAALAALDGDYPSMAAVGASAIASAAAHGWSSSVWACEAHTMLADAALHRADPVAARRYAAKGLHCAGVNISQESRFVLRNLHGAAGFDAGRCAEGHDEMQHARAALADQVLTTQHAARAAVFECRAALELGRSTAARAVLDWLTDRVGLCAEVILMQVWMEAKLGRLEISQCRDLLEPLLADGMRCALPSTPIEARLAAAGLVLEAHDRQAAEQALAEAVTQGARMDLVRPFVLAPPRVAELLAATTRGPSLEANFLARVSWAGRRGQPASVRQLSECELGVLTLLPSLLSLEEIAQDLSLSINTVKSHLRAIYFKLGVSSRRAAVEAAHERGLLATNATLIH